ncbi:MAG: peptidoglycan-binding protein [Elainellaceae cyanobacterium]
MRPLLSRGSSHPDVQKLQQSLSQQGQPVTKTGLFDYETELAVKYFQSKMFLMPDGIVGSRTWQALCVEGPAGQPILRRGSTGTAVTMLQELLSIDLYYTGEVNGLYTAQTELAVKRFQIDWGLEADGVVDHQVWQYLSNV